MHSVLHRNMLTALTAHMVLFTALRRIPITLCYPAQQTPQCHEDVYGILHPVLLFLIPLSDSLLNGINRVALLAVLKSQRNKH